MSGEIRRFETDFRRLCIERGRQTALIEARTGAQVAYHELDALADSVAAGLAALGLKPGERIVSMLPSCIEAVVVMIAAFKYGFDFAPLAPHATPREFKNWTALVDARIVLTSEAAEAELREMRGPSALPIVAIALDGRLSRLRGAEGTPLPAERSSRVYLMTSGTTGEPKAMVLDLDRLWSAGRAFVAEHDWLPNGARFLNYMPMFYLGGVFNLTLIPFAAGGSAVVAESFSGATLLGFWNLIQRFEVNVIWFVPTVLRGLLELDRRSTRRFVRQSIPSLASAAFLGTAPIDLATKTEFEKRFEIRLLENFALSETTFITTERIGDAARRSDRSVGQVLPYVEFRLGPEMTGVRAREIQVRSPYLFLGYLASGGQIQLPLDANGWFSTGDLGRIDGGVVVIEGRNRDVIKKGGLLVSLAEVERVAELHDCVVEATALPIHHEFYGEDLVVCVRVKPGSPKDVTAQIQGFLVANLLKHKWPNKVVEIDEVPRTATGKTRKNELIARLGLSPIRTAQAPESS